MATQETNIQKLKQLKGNINGISADSFRRPPLADLLKKILEERVKDLIDLVDNGTPNALNATSYILSWKTRFTLDSSKRLSWIKISLPEILALIDEINSDIDSLFGNAPPIAIMKINGVEVGQYYSAPVNTPINFDGSTSWDVDGQIVSWEWDFDDRSPVVNETTVSHTFTAIGIYRVILTVTDDGSPAEANTAWVEISIK